MWKYMCICVYVYMCICICVYMNMCVLGWAQKIYYMSTFISARIMWLCCPYSELITAHPDTLSTCMYVYVYMCIYVCMYVYMCICV
jgi:hypothetical protein